MADVNINKFRASVVRDGSKPASPGFIVSEGQDPVDPAGNGQNHLPVTIATAATGLSITDSQVLGGAGNVGQYIRGDGSLADFPQASGGGSSVSYYLNGSISQGTIGGLAYKELNKVPILGAGTDFTINANGYIASFLTDAGDPNLLEIPGGNWNFETYFSASSSGGTPTFYVELYKYDGTTFTLIASSSSSPELIAFGTNLNPYFSTLAVPTTTLALTDRLAIRYYVTHSGRTITLHTENNHLCQVVTTFTTGLTSLNGLTAQVQNLAVGTTGTDFNIASVTATHTFNLPTASATNRGALSSADWTTFNNKQNALGYVPVPETRTITINGVSQDLSANRTYNVGTVTSVGLSSATSGVTIGGSPVTGIGAFTLAIATASGSQNGLLSSTDWTTFNGKQNALTNPVTGTGTSGQIAYFTGTSAITSESGLTWDATNNNLSIGGVTANSNLTVSGSDNTDIFTVLSGLNSRLHVGTVTSPSISTYIRSQNNYALNLGTNSTNYLTILSSGNVGVNTATPATAFEVNGVGLFTGGSLVGNTKTGLYILDSNIISLDNGTGPRNLFIQAENLSFYTGSTYGEKMKLFSDGNLLIQNGGTFTNNGARLQVSGTATVSSNIAIGGTITSLSDTDELSIFAGTSIVDNRARIELYGPSHSTSANQTFVRGSQIIFTSSAAATEYMRFASTGAATFSSSVSASNYVTPALSLTPSIDLLYNSSTSGLKIWYEANNAISYIDNYYHNTVSTLPYGDIEFRTKRLGVNTLQTALIVKGYSGNVLIGTGTDGGSNQPLQIVKTGNSNYLRLQVDNNAGLDSALFFTDGTNNVYAGMMRGTSGLTGAYTIYTGGAVRLNVTSGGNVGINTNNPTSRFAVFGSSVSATIYSDNNTYSLGLGYQGTLHGYLGGISSALYGLSANGGQVLLNSSSVWVPVSDVKRKRNFEDYNLGLDAILGLKPKLYNMDFQKDGDEKQVGLVAQEVKEFIPQAFEQNADFIGLNYNAIIVTMVKAIQDQQKIINDLKQKIQ